MPSMSRRDERRRRDHPGVGQQGGLLPPLSLQERARACPARAVRRGRQAPARGLHGRGRGRERGPGRTARRVPPAFRAGRRRARPHPAGLPVHLLHLRKPARRRRRRRDRRRHSRLARAAARETQSRGPRAPARPRGSTCPPSPTTSSPSSRAASSSPARCTNPPTCPPNSPMCATTSNCSSGSRMAGPNAAGGARPAPKTFPPTGVRQPRESAPERIRTSDLSVS